MCPAARVRGFPQSECDFARGGRRAVFIGVEDTGGVKLSLKWKIAGGFGAFLLLIVMLGWVALICGSAAAVFRRRDVV